MFPCLKACGSISRRESEGAAGIARRMEGPVEEYKKQYPELADLGYRMLRGTTCLRGGIGTFRVSPPTPRESRLGMRPARY